MNRASELARRHTGKTQGFALPEPVVLLLPEPLLEVPVLLPFMVLLSVEFFLCRLCFLVPVVLLVSVLLDVESDVPLAFMSPELLFLPLLWLEPVEDDPVVS